MENRYNSIEDAENRNPIPPFIDEINSDGDLVAVLNPAYDDARYSEERWRETGRREMNTTLRDEGNLPRYGSSRQPSTALNTNNMMADELQEVLESRPPSNYEGVITESTVWHNMATPTPRPPTEVDIEYERGLADMLLQETEKIRNTPAPIINRLL